MERRRTATAAGLYDSFCHIFFFLHSFSLYIFVSQKSLNDEERGGNCLLLPTVATGLTTNATLKERKTVILAKLEDIAVYFVLSSPSAQQKLVSSKQYEFQNCHFSPGTIGLYHTFNVFPSL